MIIRKEIKRTTINRSLPVELKRAYQLVTDDLLKTFLKMKDGESVRLGNLGVFEKKEQKLKSGLDQKNYVFYLLSFRMFRTLKAELNNQLKKKYNLK